MQQRVAIWLQKRPLCFALLVMALLFTLTLLVLTPTYESNDDVGVSMVASGTGAGVAPDEHLIFSNVSIGLVLKWLYNQMPNFPWYGSYLLATQYLAFTALLFSILAWRFSWNYLGLFVLVFATLGVYSLVYLQFTRVAFLATESGIVLALTALYRRAEDSHDRPAGMLIAAGGLMVLGSLIRPGSFFGACAVALPVVVFTVWRMAEESQRRAAIWRPAIVTAATVLCLVVGAQIANAAYYAKDTAWRDFFAYNAARANFNDFGRTQYSPETRAVFDAVDWSENDHTMITTWFFDDTRVYSLENLTAIINGQDWAHGAVAWKTISRGFRKKIWRDPGLWSMWALLPIFYWQANSPRTFVKVLVLLTCSIVGMLLALMLFVKFPEAHVYYSLYAFQLLLALLLVRVGPRVQRPPAEQVFSPCLTPVEETGRSVSSVLVQAYSIMIIAATFASALIGFELTGSLCFERSRAVVEANAEMYATLAEIQPQADELFVAWGCSFPLEATLPLDSPGKNRDLQLLLTGCLTHSPIHNAMKERHQIDETVTALMSRPNVYLISPAELNEYFTIYVCEHFQTDLHWEKCYHGKQFSVWKPHPKSLSPESMELGTAMSWSQRNLRNSGNPTRMSKKR